MKVQASTPFGQFARGYRARYGLTRGLTVIIDPFASWPLRALSDGVEIRILTPRPCRSPSESAKKDVWSFVIGPAAEAPNCWHFNERSVDPLARLGPPRQSR